MATINLGNLTFTHKGDYAGGTAYVKNDVVYYATNGNSYIAKTSTTGNAPTSTAHWDLFVSGSGGIFSSSLSLGSANQVLAVNSGASALEFQNAASGKVKSFAVGTASSRTTNNYDTSNYDATIGDNGNDHIAISFTPTSATSTLFVWANCPSGVGGNGIGMASLVHDTTPIGVHIVNGYSADGGGLSISGHIASGNTNARTIRLKAVGAWNGETIYLGSARGNRTTSYGGVYGRMMIMEVE